MTKEREALRMALVALEKMESYEAMDAAITAIKEALAQQEQEPVACQYAVDVAMPEYRCVGKCQYTSPPRREWIELEAEHMDEITSTAVSMVDAMLLTEAKLKELNHG